jgi:hypothetical protein
MSILRRHLSLGLLILALLSPVMISGCAARASYNVYDPYYRDNHVWDRNEVVYYQRWESETRREHRDYHKRKAEEQREYWDWRHRH